MVFFQSVRRCSSPSNPLSVSPSTSIDYNSQEQFGALVHRPQSTPISTPRLFPRLSTNTQQTNENFTTILKSNKKRRFDTSSLTNITPLNDINNKIRSPIQFELLDDDDDDDDDEDEENHIPSLTTTKPTPPMKPTQAPRLILAIKKKKKADVPNPVIQQPPPPPPKVIPPSPKPSSQVSNEAESMLNDLESSLAQFLHNNTNSNNTPLSRPALTDDEQNRKSLQIIRSIGNMNNDNHESNVEPSMRVEWLDDAMRAERKKMIDEDEHGVSSQSQSKYSESNHGQKRPLVDSNFDQSFNTKKCRI